jgi:hypothetical protein
MFENVDLEDLAARGFIGAITCSSNGSILEATSDDLEVFGSILGYINQMADMIGEPFGMDAIDEVQLLSSNTIAISIPQDDGALGVLCSSRANVEEVLGELIN